jgi:hypothetical protein
MPRVMIYLPDKDRLYPKAFYFPGKTLLGPNRYHLDLPLDPAVDPSFQDALILAVHTFHFRPAILVHRSAHTLIEGVTIHSHCGMGIVGHDSRNILLRKVSIVPAEGDYQSTNTDGTHFTSCTGTIRLENCVFKGLGDDMTNVHLYYQTILETEGNTCRIQVKSPTYTHVQVLDCPYVGDTLELVDGTTYATTDTYHVNRVVERDAAHRCATIELDKPLPRNFKDFCLSDVTRLPRLEVVGCTLHSSLARPVLAKTRHVLVERNAFYDAVGTGIVIASEGGWHEGATSADVVIRRNKIIGCGGDGTCGVSVYVDAKKKVAGLQKRILIEKNEIRGENCANAIYISQADDVTVRQNRVTGCKKELVVENTTNLKTK